MLDEFQEVLDDIDENGFDLDEIMKEIIKDQEALLDSFKKIEASQKRKSHEEDAKTLGEINNNLSKKLRELKGEDQNRVEK